MENLSLEAVRRRFDLSLDQASPAQIDEGIRGGVAFRGTNLWVLIFAIFVASIGLNVNSTAVVIGAMLISPLMGPIMGAGYGVGVGDLALVRRALFNLALAVGISLATSTLYFLLTPLSVAHSELLARTAPTIWDVLIAFVGGLAGIIGVTRRERSNIVPGVAIATALMPPLCTAGYGLATGTLSYFAGAFYLFCINSVFIATATYLGVRLMALPPLGHLGGAHEQRARTIIAVMVVATALPSVYLAVDLIRGEVFQRRAEAFLAASFPADSGTFVVNRSLDHDKGLLQVTVVGQLVDPAQVEAMARTLPVFDLPEVKLSVVQNEQPVIDLTALKAGLSDDVRKTALALLDERNRRVEALEAQLAALDGERGRLSGIEAEIEAQYPGLGHVRVAMADPRAEPSAAPTAATAEASPPAAPDRPAASAVLLVGAEHAAALAPDEAARLRTWLGLRTGAGQVWLLSPPPAPEAQPPEAQAPKAGGGAGKRKTSATP